MSNSLVFDKRIITALQAKLKSVGECLIYDYSKPRMEYQKQRYHIAQVSWSIYFPGHPLPRDPMYKPKCGNPLCVAKDHLQFVHRYPQTKSEIYHNLIAASEQQSDGCLVHRCATDTNGYGHYNYNGKLRSLHRIVYWIHSEYATIEDIPDRNEAGERLVICHGMNGCLHKCCIIADHYVLGTDKENMLHKIRDGTLLREQTHPKTSITRQVAEQIVDSWQPDKTGLTQHQRAAAVGCTIGVVTGIDTGSTWHSVLRKRGMMPLQTRHNLNKKVATMSFSSKDLAILAARLIAASSEHGTQNAHVAGLCRRLNGNQPSNLRATMGFKGWRLQAHRWACIVNSGRLLNQGEVARHLCNNGWCVEPSHLVAGTYKENSADMRSHGTSGRKITLEDARTIRGLLSTKSIKEVAAMYNLSRAYVLKIRNNERWCE